MKIAVSALLMAGGKGTRISNPDKFLLPFGSSTIIGNLLATIKNYADRTFICGHTNKKAFQELLKGGGIEYIEGTGKGYVSDLNFSLNRIKSFPVLVVPADTVVVRKEVLEEFIREFSKTKTELLTMVDGKGPTGISLFNRIPSGMDEIPHKNFRAEEDDIININSEADYARALFMAGR